MSEPKERITVTLEPAIVSRIDTVAEATGKSRSAVMERILKEGIAEEEKFVRDMENPLKRAILETLVGNPRVLGVIATVVGEVMNREEAEEIAEKVRNQADRGRERVRVKRAPRQQSGLEGA